MLLNGENPNKINDRDVSLTFAKGLAVLKAFDSDKAYLTLPNIAALTGYDRATTRRLVLTLVRLGYVRQDNRIFSLTPRVLVLASGFLQGRQFGKTIQPVMQNFSNQISLTLSLAMLDGSDAVFVAHSRAGPSNSSYGFTIGSRIPLLATATGRALLASMPRETAMELISLAPRERYTELTCCEPDEIAMRVEETRARGHCYVDGEFESGTAALAVPIMTVSGEPASIVLNQSRENLASEEHRQELLEVLKNCSRLLASLL